MFQFTCPSRSTTDALAEIYFLQRVSIHVPLAEHDRQLSGKTPKHRVSIHVPLAEHDRCSRRVESGV